MDKDAEEKRTEKNLVVRSGISEAKITNNKRLCSTFCIEAIQTQSIAWPLCDSRASCPYVHGKRYENSNMKQFFKMSVLLKVTHLNLADQTSST